MTRLFAVENAMPDDLTPTPTPTDDVSGDGMPGTPEFFAEPTAEPAVDEAAPEAVQEADDEGDTETEAPGDPAEMPSDRRQRRIESRQAAEAARKAEVDQAVADALAAREQLAQAQAAQAARAAEDERIGAEMLALAGTPDDENNLINRVADGDAYAADELKQLRANKALMLKMGYFERQKVYADLMPQLWTAKSLPGVDATVIDGVKSFSEALVHVSESMAKVKDAEWSAKLERQKADYESRLGRAAAGMPTTETGGRAVGALNHVFTRDQIARMDTATYKKFKADIYAQEARGLIT